MKFARLLKGKLLVAVLLGITVASGTTAVFAATPAGRSAVHAIMAMAHAQDALHRDGHHTSGHKAAGRNSSTCPGLPEAQQLAAKYALSTSRDGGPVQAICALHRGTFVGNTPAGASVSSQQVFGYGEIDKLLASAQFLATHDQANEKLTDSNVRSFLALALQNCGTNHLETCLKTNVQRGKSGSNNGGNGHGHKHGNSNGHG